MYGVNRVNTAGGGASLVQDVRRLKPYRGMRSSWLHLQPRPRAQLRGWLHHVEPGEGRRGVGPRRAICLRRGLVLLRRRCSALHLPREQQPSEVVAVEQRVGKLHRQGREAHVRGSLELLHAERYVGVGVGGVRLHCLHRAASLETSVGGWSGRGGAGRPHQEGLQHGVGRVEQHLGGREARAEGDHPFREAGHPHLEQRQLVRIEARSAARATRTARTARAARAARLTSAAHVASRGRALLVSAEGEHVVCGVLRLPALKSVKLSSKRFPLQYPMASARPALAA
eukprot:scaffold10248_cov65-Phaeocystis_antarctica.AAC.1